jgi:hypothetical protein
MATLPLSPNFTNLNAQLNTQLASAVGTSDAVNNLPSSYVNNNLDLLGSTSLKSDQIIDYTIRENPLHQYSSFNYTISLEATDNQGVNSWNDETKYKSKYKKDDWIPIIRSGGIVTGAKNRFDPGGNTVQRKYFKSDLYIDNLEVETLVATSAVARSSTDCKVSFTIIEPYGMSFLEDLWQFNINVIKSKSYLETAYLLKIGYKGFNDDGKFIDLQEYIKYIPIRLINVELKFTNAGAVYTVEAIPYNDQGNDEIYGRVRTSGKLIGKTVGEMLRGDTYITKGQIEAANPTNKQKLLDEFEYYQSDFSLATILTENSQKTAEKNEDILTATNDEFIVKFADETDTIPSKISEAIIIDPKDNPYKDVKFEQLRNNKGSYSSSLAAKTLSNMVKYRKLSGSPPIIIKEPSTMQLNGGENIHDVISSCISGSNYITDQIKKFRTAYNKAAIITNPDERLRSIKSLQGQLNWFRIQTQILPTNNFNINTNRYAKKIIFNVLPYVIENSNSPDVPKQPITNIVKEYNYYFTGKNIDILNLDLTFNTAYINTAGKNIGEVSQGTGEQSKNTNDQNTVGSTIPVGQHPIKLAQNTIYTDSSRIKTTGQGNKTSGRIKSSDLSSILYDPTALMNVKLDILGDPDLIKQDGIWLIGNDTYDKNNGPPNDSTQSIMFDDREAYVSINFLTPRDYNLDTGLMLPQDLDFQDNQKTSMFSGKYRIITVHSVFKEGKFTQSLDLLRVIEEEEETTSQESAQAELVTSNIKFVGPEE